jgi:hypothetical protein
MRWQRSDGTLPRVRFRFEFLVRVWAAPPLWRALCAPALVAVEAESKTAAIDLAREELRTFVQTEAREQVHRLGGGSEVVRCPEGTVHLLADRWFCKVTHTDCPIAAELARLDLEWSLGACNAPERTKEGVRGAIRAGYPGLHHSPGTYVCPRCRETSGYRTSALHYEWELQTLDQVLDIDETDALAQARAQLMQKCGNTQAMSSGHCTRCVREVIELAFPELSSELEIIPMQLDERWTRQNSGS